MQHYDGPAFYRKQNKKIKQKMHEVLPKNADKINNKKSQVFHPSYVPPSFGSWQYPAKKRKQKYQNLFERLQKKANDYLLFDESETVGKSKIKIIAESEFDALNQKRETSKTHVSKEASALESKPTTVDNFDNDEKDHVDSAMDNVLNRQYLSENKPVQEKPVQEKSEKAIKDNGELDIVKSTPVSEKNELNKTASDEIKVKQINLNDRNKSQEISDKQDTGAETTEKVDMIDNVPAGIQKDDTEKSTVNVKEKLEGATVVSGYEFPDMNLLPKPVQVNDDVQDEWVLEQIDTLNETLEAFHVDATVKDWTIGPAVTQFELTLGRGVKVNKITNLIDDLKLALAAKDIRIEAPIPGRSSVGIEIPNLKPRPVMLSEVLNATAFASKSSPLTVALGVNLSGESIVTDLRKMPHGLIAGATGSGKSVFINSILISLLYKATPQQVKLLLIDPKAVEMAPYHDIPHLLAPVISDPVAASAALKWVVEEMEERYQKLAAAGVRNIEGFNKKVIVHEDYGLQMPYIVIIIDELADLMMIASSEVQDYIARITQKARAAGIHLLIATQRPSVDVITGTIKNNIPTRVAFMVSSQIDSRTIIDTAGAERLLGRGDMLYLGNGASQPIRLQGTYVQNEVEKITDFVRTQGQPQYAFDPDGLKKQNIQNKQEDEILPEVLDCLVNEDSISTSKLQRIFAIGYNRAANIIDTLEERRYISPARGSKPRDVYLTQEGLDKLRENNDY
ncbi:DNA translocase FtsK [Liquorilactobacillus mali]|uniref:DNA translocase FtsK n=1 Tax=Liquorilactobacillus mali TaxID=1618 RepID=UPI002350EEAB|nr:DNA translocase FtsK [Liquorilactobacillus mali]MDC7951858.1 DNA translocase FtsK [Liquorilactobacillus mali]